MNKKKSGLSKKISSIFQGIPDLKEGTESAPAPSSAPSAGGRNAVIPLEKGFCHFRDRGGFLTPRRRSVLDIGASGLKWICIEKKNRKDALSGIAYIPLPSTQDPNRFAQSLKLALKALRERAGPVREADLVLSEPPASFFPLAIAKGNEKRVRQVLTSDMVRRNPQWKPEDFVTGFFVSERPSREKVGALHVTAAHVRKSELEGWIEAIEDGGWQVGRIEGVPFAFETLVSRAKLDRLDEVIAVLEMGANHTFIYFYRGGLLEYLRRIPIAAEDLTRSFLRPIIGEEGKVELTLEEAQELRRSLGIPYGEGEVKTTLGKRITYAQIHSLVRMSLERLAREIEGSINFYLRTYQLASCRRLFLTGGGAELPNLLRFLRESLRLERIEFLKPFELLGLKAPEADLGKVESLFGPALGLALSDRGKLDLRPAKLRLLHGLERFRFVFNRAAAFVFGVLAVFWIFDFSHLRIEEKYFRQAYGSFTKAKAAMTRVELLESKKEELSRAIHSYKQAVGSHPAWEYALSELSKAVLDQVYLNDFKLTSENDAWMLWVKGVVLPGKDSVEHVLSELLVRVGDSPVFDQAMLVSSRRMGPSIGQGIEFELKCLVKAGVGKNA